MINDVLPLCLLAIIILPSRALSGAVADPLASQINWLPRFWPSTHLVDLDKRAASRSGINYNPNGSAFVWLQQDEYAGKTFFELVLPQLIVMWRRAHGNVCVSKWNFFTNPDPTQ